MILYKRPRIIETMQIQLSINNLSKTYSIHTAIKSVNVEVHQGEFLAIVGPSGCGKSTLLKSIAGLETPDTGEIILDNRVIFSASNKIDISPEKREVALVFQNYALWPHFNIYKNIAYPLMIRKIPKTIIKEKVTKYLKLVRLIDKENRYPHELSGGEQQRVSLARALIMSPKLLLLDEPFSNLDAKLREMMQIELKKIHLNLGLTIVHVTHDQSEAMELADRIVVMNEGQIIQSGTPQDIYRHPSSCFIANFIGKTNLLYSDNQATTDLFFKICINNNFGSIPGKVLSIRPEEIKLDSHNGDFKATVIQTIYHGAITNYVIKYYKTKLTVQADSEHMFTEGDKVYFTIGKVIILDY